MQPAMMPQGFVVANACLTEWQKSWHLMGTAISAFWGCFKTCEKKALRPGPGQGGNQPNQMQQHGATESHRDIWQVVKTCQFMETTEW